MASDAPWRTEGSVLVGLDLVRSVMDVEGGVKEQARAKVIGWLSASESDFEDTRGDPAPLYRIKYLDGALAGDEEDLEEYEVRNSVPDADRRALAEREGVPYVEPTKKRKPPPVKKPAAKKKKRGGAIAASVRSKLPPRVGLGWRLRRRLQCCRMRLRRRRLRGLAAIDVDPVDVVGVTLSVGKEQDRIIAGPASGHVVALPLGELPECLERVVVHPDVSAIRTSVVTALGPDVASLEHGTGSVGAANRPAPEGVVDPPGFTPANRDLERPWRAMEISIQIGGEEHLRLPIGVDPHPGKSRGSVQIGYSADVRTIGFHRPEIHHAVSIALEDDFGTVWRPSRIVFTSGVARQAAGLTPLVGDLPEIASPAEDDGLTIRTDGRETWEIHVSFPSRSGWGQGRQEDEKHHQ